MSQLESINPCVETKQIKAKATNKKNISSRELQVLKLCYEQGILTKRQLRHWLFHRFALKNEATAKTVATRISRYLCDQNYIKVFSIPSVRDKQAFSITAKGMSVLLDQGYQFSQKMNQTSWTDDQVRHDVMASDVRLAWEQVLPKCYWYPELLLKNNSLNPMPDALMGYYSGSLVTNVTIAMEIEMTQKSQDRYIKKFREYEQSLFDLVFYFTAKSSIADMVLKTSKNISDIIYVVDLEAFINNPVETSFVSHSDKFTIKEKMEHVWN